MFKYIKKAFFFHWNLLALGAGAALGLIVGRPDVMLPVLAAGELAYLVGLATRPRFQAAVDAAENKEIETARPQLTDKQVGGILSTLSKEDRKSFEQLKSLCLEMARIARQVKGGQAADPGGVSEIHMQGLNRLLWIYLKLLASRNALERYFQTTRIEDIQAKMKLAQERLSALGPPEEDDPAESRQRKSLEDTLETCRQRVVNFEEVRQHHEFLELEQERLHAKIASLAEMGLKRQDPEFLTHEIDVVSDSVEKTESTLGELDFLTKLSVQDAEPPPLLDSRRKVAAVRGR